MRRVLGLATIGLLATYALNARADTFAPGSLIIPMDTTYQDQGTLRSFGLLYELLRQGVPVRWVIRTGKAHLGVDFTATGVDLQTNAAINAHGYRGGPFVIDSVDAPTAIPLIQAFQSANPSVKVHKTTLSFSADVSRYLVAAPRTAMHQDGNEGIARSYMVAAGIPDSTLDYTWANTSPDLLSPAEVAGASTTNHHDGKLFDAKGNPAYCQFMSMHWAVNQAQGSPETVAEVREYLKNNTHLFAECQAVNAFENLVPSGFFVTTQGFVSDAQPKAYDFLNNDQPFAQVDGAFLSVGGSEPSYTLAPGSSYKVNGIVMIKAQGSAPGVKDVWMTGFLDGACPPVAESCLGLGKVSYLGGHQYPVKLPISANPSTNGVRLFLNSLFEAPCITNTGAAKIKVVKSAPAATAVDTVTFTLAYTNTGATTAFAVSIEDALPSGTSFVSCSGGCTVSSGVVKWNLGSVGAFQSGLVSVTVKIGAFGNYFNTGTAKYQVGVTSQTATSNTTLTVYDKDTDGDSVPDVIDVCPLVYNPNQDLQNDPLTCGSCSVACSVANGTPGCSAGQCFVYSCDAAHEDCNALYSDGCEYITSGFATDPNNCGSCGNKCAYPNAQGVCSGGACSLGGCNSGFSNCNGLTADGCEYPTSGFASDPNNCGSCGNKCASGFTCSGGACVVNQCPLGFSDCNANPADGCEYANTGFQTDPNNCGSCGKLCAPQNATGQCVGGNCSLVGCSGGFSDCNGQAADGCEYANTGFQTDPNNCGACGQKCAPANATGQCASGACAIVNCDPGFSDCNGSASDGCEFANTGFQTDPNNCGACGQKCAPANASPDCTGGVCGIATCSSGYVDADKDAANGCECNVKGATDVTCDGVDDDCNGQPDDAFVQTQCGTGACVASSVCSGGQVSCTPGAPSTEGPANDSSCSDAVDNDCDGLVDVADPDCASNAGTDSGSGGAAGGGASDAAVDGNAGSAGAPADSGLGGAAGTTSGGSGGSSAGGAPSGGSDGSAASGGAKDAGAKDAGAGARSSASSGDEGGCGCRTAPSRPLGSLAWVLIALGASLIGRRHDQRIRVRRAAHDR